MFKRGLQFGTGAGVALLMTAIVYAVASYPTSVISFPVRANGQTITADWFNLVYDEVSAIEGGLLNGLAHDLKFTDGLFDIGKSGATRPRDLFLSRNATVGGTLGVTGASTLAAVSATTGAFTGAITATGGQIAFPATQAASAGANTLDDYEEGSWTPVIGGSGGTSGQTYGTQTGRYIKIGKLVIAQFQCVLTAKGTITGNVEIQGLPFTSDTGSTAIESVYFGTLATNWIHLVTRVLAGATVASVVGNGAAAANNGTNLVTADIANATSLEGTITYRATN